MDPFWGPGPQMGSPKAALLPVFAEKNTFQICPLFPLCPVWPNVPLLQQGSLPQETKMVLGHSLNHIILWLHFEFWRRGSACFFGANLFRFGSQGPILGTQNPQMDPRSQIWLPTRPGRCFEQIPRSKKHGFVEEWFRKWGLWDFP